MALARERHRVGLIGLNDGKLHRVAEEVIMFGGEPFIEHSDVRDHASVQDALLKITERGWEIPETYISAGICESLDMQNFQAEKLDEIMRVNFAGTANWLEALQPVLRAQEGGGAIAVLSSLSADRAIPGGGAGYSASKAAVSQLLDGLRAPWARQGIRLVTVTPGFVNTAMIEGVAHTPLAIEPDRAAHIIIKGVRRGARIIRFHWLAALGMGAVRFLPARLLDLLDRGEGDVPKLFRSG